MKKFQNKEFTIELRDLLLLLLFGVLSFLFILHHEPWRDELQSWLITRDLSPDGILSELRNEGHFFLWFLILKPCTLFREVSLLNEVSWGLCLIAAFLLIMFAPFRRSAKAALLFSAPFFYWYPVVARCYALIPLLLFLLAMFWKERETKPVRFAIPVMLLANTHPIAEGFACGIFLLRLAEILRKGKGGTTEENRSFPLGILSLILMAFSAAAAFFQVWPSTSNSPRSSFSSMLDQPFRTNLLIIQNYAKEACQMFREPGNGILAGILVLMLIGMIFLLKKTAEDRKDVISLCISGVAGAGIAVFLAVLPSKDPERTILLALYQGLFCAVFLYGTWFLFRISKRFGILFLLSIAMLYIITAGVYPFVTTHRAMYFLFVFAFCVWCAESEQETPRIRSSERIMTALSLLMLPGLIVSVCADWNRPFSALEETGVYIRKNIPQDAFLTYWPHDDTTTVLSAFLPERKIHSLTTGRPDTFFRRSGAMLFVPPDELIRIRFTERNTGYLILPVYAAKVFMDSRKELADFCTFECVYTSSWNTIIPQEQFSILKITAQNGTDHVNGAVSE